MKTIIIEKETAREFLLNNVIGDYERGEMMGAFSHYNLLKDEIIIKKELANDLAGKELLIVVADYSKFSRQTLYNHYTYELEDYDYISYRGKLKAFVVLSEGIKQPPLFQ